MVPNLSLALLDSEDARESAYVILKQVMSVVQHNTINNPASVEENMYKLQKVADLYLETVKVQKLLHNWIEETTKPAQVPVETYE